MSALGERRDEFELLALGAVPIRGKEKPVKIWSVKYKR